MLACTSCASLQPRAMAAAVQEHFDVLTETGEKTGRTAPRGQVHAEGLFHRAVHTWLYSSSTGELLLQRRAFIKDSWAGYWDISSAGHLSAGQASLAAAERELWEELGLHFPLARFEYLHTHLEKLSSVQKGRPFTNNEFNDVYLLTLTPQERGCIDPAAAIVQPLAATATCPVETTLALVLQEAEVSAVAWLPWRRVRDLYNAGLKEGGEGGYAIVPSSDPDSYGRLWTVIEAREAADARRAQSS